jgi:hypothetical protein
MNEYLHQLVRLIEEASIDESADLIIVANEGEPATLRVQLGHTVQFFIENEDQSKLLLLSTTSI